MALASEVPSRYDVVINGTGYLLLEEEESRSVYGYAKAAYSYSPTFLERQNVQGDYGDDQQAFWLTASQNDWTLGEDQRFYRSRDQDSRSRFWRGANVDVRIPGQVSIRPDRVNITMTSLAQSVCSKEGFTGTTSLFAVTTGNLYEIAQGGVITDRGVHGLGVAPSNRGLAADNVATGLVYISSTTSGSAGVRKWNGSAFSTFSTSGADSLAVLNNTLYGYRADRNDLVRWDTAGNITSLFQWKGADGTTASLGLTNGYKLLAFGGKLLMLTNDATPSRLWMYDGVGVSLLQQFENNFTATDMAIAYGIVYVSGYLAEANGAGGTNSYQAVFYYANGTTGLVWRAPSYALNSNQGSYIVPFGSGLVWSTQPAGLNQYIFHNPITGGIHRFTSTTSGGGGLRMAAGATAFLDAGGGVGTACTVFPASYVASNASITTSLFDFDTSVDKLFRGVRVDYIAASDGNSGTVDVLYRLNDLDGSYTASGTGITSGSEVSFATSVIGRALSVQIVLGKGTSTLGPVLKRMYLRGAPLQLTKRLVTYTLDCSGDQDEPQELRDGTPNPKTGREMANDLVTAVTSSVPFTITDRFGSFTGILEPPNFRLDETHAEPALPQTATGTFVAKVMAREI